MLEKIIRVDGVGIFHNGSPAARDLAKLTLIYADNARGKSTLSAILRAAAAGDAAALTSRPTIGGTRPAAVHLRFKDGTASRNIKFENGSWDSKAPHLHVFDNAFVENNVYAASEVSTGHHEALLDFALGTAAVDKRLEVEKHGDAQTAATRARSEAEGKLTGYRGTTPLNTFIGLAKDDEADVKIADLERRIANSRESAALNSRPSLRAATLPAVGWAPFEAILKATFQQMQEGATAKIEEHFRKHYWRGIDRWVDEGRRNSAHKKLEECPFCGQSTTGLDLIKAYETYFNAAYNEHMRQVASLRSLVDAVMPSSAIDTWVNECTANRDRANGWKPQLEFEVAEPNFEKVRELAVEVRHTFQQAAEQKAGAPLDAVDPAVLEAARSAAAELDGALKTYNDGIATVNSAIDQFKKGLAAENVPALQQQVSTLGLRKVRHSEAVVALINERTKADERRTVCAAAKEKAQQELNQLMKDLLVKYQSAINKWLGTFGAPFSIEDMGYTYQGKTTPRTEYAIVLRKKKVPAGKKSAEGLTFQNALSEGDKRTLALAVFLARIEDDPQAASTVIVLDDIFASLDLHRRVTTMSAIASLARVCAQVIILAHDPFFLKDLARGLQKKKLGDPVTLQIRRAADDYSELDDCDLAEKCRSPFHTRYRELAEYMAGRRDGQSPLRLAEGLRPLVEGALHRRFPGLIREGETFGAILEQIRTAPADSPLAPLQAQLPAFNSFNDYAGAYHHDTFDVQPRQDVNDGELQVFGKRTLDFIHHGQI